MAGMGRELPAISRPAGEALDSLRMSADEQSLLFGGQRRHAMRWAPTMFIACVALLFSSSVGNAIDVPAWVVAITSLAVAVSAYYMMARPFRCPGCNTNLLIHATFREPVGNWIEKALAYRSCPKCGYTGHGIEHPSLDSQDR